ncbi:SLC13 family permease [Derxia lacustris]|uniref:SLC13 family permease n=1 Tax=Derxia lacustris TaxID=764842 RepID=UPI000A1771A2|nr:SLC13 family permease [Derxia lacustris]
MRPPSALARSAGRLLRDPVLLTLLAALPALGWLSTLPVARWPGLIDWDTLAALAGLLVLTKGVELSQGLHLAGQRLIARLPTERALALGLVAAAALLSTVLTNDVALFVLVPFTLGLGRLAQLPVARLVVFEALAVNAGSALTPIGNPQNLFLWQRSGVGFGAYMLAMLPMVALACALLLALAAIAFRGRGLALAAGRAAPALDRPLLFGALALYPPFLLLTHLHRAPLACALVIGLFALLRRRLLARADWGLILVFALMFVDLGLLAGLEPVRAAVAGLGVEAPARLYWLGIATSQFISNVPAALLLARLTDDWQTLAIAVNVGGFGLAPGSLANLIALRLAGRHGSGWLFHAWSLPFLLLLAPLVCRLAGLG